MCVIAIQEPDIPGIPHASTLTISEYAKCAFPADVAGPGQPAHGGGPAVARWFDDLNDALGPGWWPQPGQLAGCDVLSFSHFLPDQRLLPEKCFLTYANLVSGRR